MKKLFFVAALLVAIIVGKTTAWSIDGTSVVLLVCEEHRGHFVVESIDPSLFSITKGDSCQAALTTLVDHFYTVQTSANLGGNEVLLTLISQPG